MNPTIAPIMQIADLLGLIFISGTSGGSIISKMYSGERPRVDSIEGFSWAFGLAQSLRVPENKMDSSV